MNVRKIVKKIATVGATTGILVGATMMGAVAASSSASLESMPAPFVEDGVADFQLVLGQGAAVADVIGAVDISNALQANSVTQTAVEIAGSSTAVVENGYLIDGNNGDSLLFGEVASATTNVDDQDLPELLAEGNIKDKDGDDGTAALNAAVEEETDYDVEIDLGGFFVNFGTPESLDDPIVYLDFAESYSGYTYSVLVDLDDAIDFTAMDDNEVIEIAGRPFTIGESGSSVNTLSLFGSDSTVFVQLNQPQTIVVDGQSVELEVVGGNSDANNGDGSIVLSVNGERETLEEGETETFAGDVEIFVRDLFVTNIPTLDASATLFVGGEEIELRDGNDVEINGEDLDGYEFQLTGDGADLFNETTMLNFTFNAGDLDDEESRYLVQGQSLVDPFFGTFELNFAGSSLDLMDSSKVPFSMDVSSDEIDITFVNDDNDELSFTAFELVGSQPTLYNDNSGNFIAGGQNLLVEDDYFLGQDGDTTSLFEIVKIDFQDGVDIKNLGTGTTFNVDNGASIDDTQYTITIDAENEAHINLSAAAQTYFLLKGGARVDILVETVDFNLTGVEFAEDTSDYDDLLVGDLGTFNVTIQEDPSEAGDLEMAVANVAGFTTAIYDNDDEAALSDYGTYYVIDEDGQTFDLYTPDEVEVEYFVYVAPTGAQAVIGGGANSVTSQVVNPVAVGAAVLDADVSLATTNSNLIVVGGPSINSVAAELLGFPTTEEILNIFAPSTAMIELFDLDNGKVAMLVAGYEAEETQAAARAVATFDSRLRGDQVKLQVTSLNDFTISTVE